MNSSKTTFGLLAALVLLALCSPIAQAQEQYNFVTLFTNSTTLTNVATATTNLSVTASGTNGVNLTKWDGFTLWIDGIFTNATAGPLNITYESSYDGLNWNTNKGLNGLNGWFGVPCTNDGIRTIFGTNITVGGSGYWRIGWITNQTGQALTNLTIRAYRKPARQGSYP